MTSSRWLALAVSPFKWHHQPMNSRAPTFSQRTRQHPVSLASAVLLTAPLVLSYPLSLSQKFLTPNLNVSTVYIGCRKHKHCASCTSWIVRHADCLDDCCYDGETRVQTGGVQTVCCSWRLWLMKVTVVQSELRWTVMSVKCLCISTTNELVVYSNSGTISTYIQKSFMYLNVGQCPAWWPPSRIQVAPSVECCSSNFVDLHWVTSVQWQSQYAKSVEICWGGANSQTDLWRYCSTKLCDGAQMANFASGIFSEPHAGTFQTCILNLH